LAFSFLIFFRENHVCSFSVKKLLLGISAHAFCKGATIDIQPMPEKACRRADYQSNQESEAFLKIACFSPSATRAFG